MVKEIIKSKSNKNIKYLKYILNIQNSKKIEDFLLFSKEAIKKADKKGLVKQIFSFKDDKDFKNLILIEENLFKSLNSKTQFLALCSKLPKIEKFNDTGIYLDNIKDPSNLGNIILLAKEYGYKDVLISSGCTDFYSYKVIEIIEDFLLDLNIKFNCSIETLKEYQNKGYKILSTGLKSSVFLDTVNRPEKFIVVLGNEASGVKEEILDISDKVIKIPIVKVDSLNVACAAGIVLEKLK